MPFTLKEIAESVGGELIGDEEIKIRGINSLEGASKGEISFFYDRRYKKKLKTTRASALLVASQNELFQGAQVIVSNPALAYARTAALFAPSLSPSTGISDDAVIHESSKIGEGVSIYPFVYVGEDAVIGDHVTLYPGVFIDDRVRIGEKSILYPNTAILYDCVIGSEVIIQAGCIIGSDGFGYVRDGDKHVKIPHLGIVQIDDNVEIGANAVIDRAALGKTWVRRGAKLDDLVVVSHNVEIGEDTIMVTQGAIGGSTRIGKGVVIGGQVAISDHVEIGDRVMIGSKSGVPKSLSEGQVVSGIPVMPHKLWLKTSRLIPRLPVLNERIRDLEKKVKELEKRLKD